MLHLTRRLAALLGLVVVASLLPTAAWPSPAADGDTIVGDDGAVYPAAPSIVRGRGRELFFGRTFDEYCADSEGFSNGVRQLTRLARVIRASGRTVVFTVAPDKPTVSTAKLPAKAFPHGRCDRAGIRARARALDTLGDPSYLPIRRPLARAKGRVYWKTDPHWTTVGAAVYARELAARLDHRLGAQVRFAGSDPQTRLWPMASALGRQPERVPAVRPAWNVRVIEKRGHYDVTGVRTFIDHTWRSTPASRTWRGRTLVLGDSFTFLGLRALRPLFQRARFLWIGPANLTQMREAIVAADTVVIEVAEILLLQSSALEPSFLRSIRQALR